MAAEGRPQPPLQFDLFELDPTSYQLRRRGMPVDLPPQAMRILVLLAAHPDELVSRKEIKEALWPGQSYGDFDSRLNFAIKKLREALGDDAEQPRYVQTVRNGGYRFIAPVREAQVFAGNNHSAHRANAAVHSNGVQDASGRRAAMRESRSPGDSLGFWGRNPIAVLAAVILILILAAVAAVFNSRTSSPGVRASERPGAASPHTGVEYEPHIVSVSRITPDARQRIVVTGAGFGLHVPYAHTDSPYLAIRDKSTHWAAGRIVPHNSDEVMVDVENWTDSEIVVTGFSGDYGKDNWKLNVGDDVEIAVWNPQSSVGPALYRTKVVDSGPKD